MVPSLMKGFSQDQGYRLTQELCHLVDLLTADSLLKSQIRNVQVTLRG